MFKYLLGLFILLSTVLGHATAPTLRNVEGDVFPGLNYQRNLLINGDFQSPKVNYGWTVSAGTPTKETSTYYFDGRQGLKVALSATSGTIFYQLSRSTTHVFTTTANLEASIWLSNDASNVQVCMIKTNSTTEITCKAVSTDALWHKYEFQTPATNIGDAWGLKVKATSAATGSLYAAHGFVGVSDYRWSMFGNASADSTVAFIGTTDAQDLVFKVNNTERMRIKSAGSIGLGTSSPNASLDVTGSVKIGTTLSLAGSTSGSVGFKAPAIAGSTIFTVPSSDGSSGQALTTNGAGQLTFATIAGSSGGLTYTGVTLSGTSAVNTIENITTNSNTTRTLPTAVGNQGASIEIGNSGTGTVTINTTSAQTISTWSSGNLKLMNAGEAFVFMSDGTNWILRSHKLKVAQAAFDTATCGNYTTSTNSYLRFNETPTTTNVGITAAQDATNGSSFTFDRPGIACWTLAGDVQTSAQFSYRMYLNGSLYKHHQCNVNGSGQIVTTCSLCFRVSAADVIRLNYNVNGISGLTCNGLWHATLTPEF
jgi:hypothetical protein